MTRIGFIGTGIMGGPMAANLVKAGHDVTAYGRGATSRDRAIASGASVAESAAGAVDGAEIVITMLPDGPDVAALLLGDDGGDGVLPHIPAGALLVDMSSISPAVARQVAAAATEHGVGALDAPVSGGEAAAIEGTLSIMVGGDEEHVARALPVLRAMGTNVVRVGGIGTGQTAKAANQLIVAANIQAVAEAIVFLDAAGVELGPALEAISKGLAGSTVLERKLAAFLSGTFTPGFRVELHNKDLRNVQAAATDDHLALPLAALMGSLMASLDATGHGGDDHSALLWLARHLNGA